MNEFIEPENLFPDWGPYSKKYMGISKVVPQAPIEGARFDCVVHPMEANMNQPLPNVTFPSSWHIWEAAPDLSYYAYRVELEWKDKLYAQVSFSEVDHGVKLIRTEFVNNTEIARNCVLNYYLAMEYPWKQRLCLVDDEKITWKKVIDYDFMEYHTPRPWEHLMPDGLHRAEFFDSSFVGGRGFGAREGGSHLLHEKQKPFGAESGDCVILTILTTDIADMLTIRYRTVWNKPARFALTIRSCTENIAEISQEMILPVAEELSMVSISVESLQIGSYEIKLVSLGEGGVEFDFAALHRKEQVLEIRDIPLNYEPKCTGDKDGYILEYQEVPEQFIFKPMTNSLRFRRITSGSLEDALPSRLSQADPSFDDVTKTFSASFKDKHSDDGFYLNFIVHSIFIPAGEKHVEYALVGDRMYDSITAEEAEHIYDMRRVKADTISYLPDGQEYRFSNRLLQATLLTNIVYPVYRHGTWIKHHTPGKRWDSLYTWDSGFIGLGLLEVEERLAEYVLDIYLSTPDNHDFAFLMHGSPVPVQVYLYLELLQRSHDKTQLLSWYPRLRRYYRYMAGKDEGSATDPFRSRLTTTFDYFYSCCGMDDLPPQAAMYERGMQKACAPAFTTSQLIRIAKILRMVATEMGIDADIEELDEDIKLRTKALLQYSWDEESGYFGYVVHDKNGVPVGIFRTEDGENLSKGMDGIYPLVAGICTKEQEEKLCSHLFSDKEMFSPLGISAVDMSASYYRDNGYWNGNVWFAHQWFIWKTMLDMQMGDNAWRIARTALEAWKVEVEHSYFTFEMLNIATGRGGWFHQFGGLSSPINIWANAYYKPGTVTCGFDVWIHEQIYEEEQDKFFISLTNHSMRPGTVLAVLRKAAADDIEALLNDTSIPVVIRTSGAVEFSIPPGIKHGNIILTNIPKCRG